MSKYFSALLLSLLLKFLYIIVLASKIDFDNKSKLEKILGSWCLVEIIFIFFSFLLSTCNVLQSDYFYSVILFTLVCLFFSNRIGKFQYFLDINFKKDLAEYILYFCIIILFIFFLYRSCFYYDNTWDALTYEMTRILLYSSYKSIMVFQPTLEFNIFANEWNGELNSLFYVLFTDNDQGMSFGNVEVWLIYLFSIIWFVSLFNVKEYVAVLIGILFATTPIAVGLSMTLKGDLLGWACYILALGFSWKSFKTKKFRDYNFIYAICALGLGCGAKIVLLPGAIILAIGLMIDYLYKRKNLKFFVISLGLFIVGNLRYVLNIYHYQQPFKHIEEANYSINNLIENLSGIFNHLMNFKFSGNTWILSHGFGYLGVGILFLFIANMFFLICNFKIIKKFKFCYSNFVISNSVIVGFVYLLCALHWEPWALRYFIIYLNPIILFSAVCVSKKIIKFKSYYIYLFLYIGLISVAFINFTSYFEKYGESNPIPIEEIIKLSEMQRKFIFHPYLLDSSLGLSENEIKNKSFLLINQIDSLSAIYFGEHHENKIRFVSTIDRMDDYYPAYDYVIFNGFNNRYSERILNLKSDKYQFKFKNEFRIIFQKKNN